MQNLTWAKIEQNFEGVERQPREEENGSYQNDENAHSFSPEKKRKTKCFKPYNYYEIILNDKWI